MKFDFIDNVVSRATDAYAWCRGCTMYKLIYCGVIHYIAHRTRGGDLDYVQVRLPR